MPRPVTNNPRNDRNQGRRNSGSRQHGSRNNTPRNTSQNRDQRCSLCDKTGHTRDKCFNNPANFKCKNENCKSRGTHETKDCKMRNGNKRDGVCDHCNKKGHSSDDCYKKRSGDVSMTSPTHSYCAHCNTTDHATSSCRDALSFKRYSESLLRCARCREKGHSHDECRNPAGKRCSKCLFLGHGRENCPVRHNKDLKSPATPARNVFATIDGMKVDGRSRFRFEKYEKLHKTQQERLKLERHSHDVDFQKSQMTEAQIYKADREIEQAQRYIEAEERKIFPRSPRSRLVQEYDVEMRTPTLPAFEDYSRHTWNGPSRYPSYTMTLGGRRASTPNARFSRWITKEGGNGNDPVVQERIFAALRETERLILNKISNSRLGYRESGVWNNFITRNELAIMEAGVVTQQRMDQIKWLLQTGAYIHRDPMAMAALFARKVPICTTCNTRGIIVNEHFEPVPVDAPITELFLLRDVEHPGWGLFIVFRCRGRCSKEGYRFERVPIEEMNGKDVQNDPLYYPWGDL